MRYGRPRRPAPTHLSARRSIYDDALWIPLLELDCDERITTSEPRTRRMPAPSPRARAAASRAPLTPTIAAAPSRHPGTCRVIPLTTSRHASGLLPVNFMPRCLDGILPASAPADRGPVRCCHESFSCCQLCRFLAFSSPSLPPLRNHLVLPAAHHRFCWQSTFCQSRCCGSSHSSRWLRLVRPVQQFHHHDDDQ